MNVSHANHLLVTFTVNKGLWSKMKMVKPVHSLLRGVFLSLFSVGQLQLWSRGRSHGVAGHSACRRGENPHSGQPIPVQHGRRCPAHLHGVDLLNHGTDFLLIHVRVIFSERLTSSLCCSSCTSSIFY